MLGVIACYKFACFMCSRAYMLSVPACLGARVFSMLACFMSLRAHISYKLAVLKYLTCLRAWYPSLAGVWQRSKCSSKGPFKKYLINWRRGRGRGSSRKKVMKEKWNRGWVWCQKKFSAHFFGDTVFAPSYLSNRFNNIAVSNNKKYPKGYITSEIAVLSHPKHHNSIISWKSLVNTCASMWKSECTHRL